MLVNRIEAKKMVADPIALLNVARSVPFRLGRAAWRISLPRHVQLLRLNLGVSAWRTAERKKVAKRRRAFLKRRAG